MIKYIAFILIVALRIGYHPSPAESATAPFAKPSSSAIAPAANMTPAEDGIITNKTILNREVDQHETADLFEAEKSTDKKSVTTANYRFYEKAGKQSVLPSL